jgi:F-type H+-transporting ATPase subunit delta
MRREPVLVPKVDPSIIGGMVLQAGDKVYDHSVRSRLNNIRTQLLARGTHEISTGRDRFSDLG